MIKIAIGRNDTLIAYPPKSNAKFDIKNKS